MARFSMCFADPKIQIFDDIVVYRLKDNSDKDSPINKWTGTEENCRVMMKWLNENCADKVFDFRTSNTIEKENRLSNMLGCGVEINNATINNTLLVKLDKPIRDLRFKISSAFGIDGDAISIYNTEIWNDRSYGGDDLAIINKGLI